MRVNQVLLYLLVLLSGCAHRSREKSHTKLVEVPVCLRLADMYDNQEQFESSDLSKHTLRKDKKKKISGMAYKPATFLLSDACGFDRCGYEDIPLPIGVMNAQYYETKSKSGDAGARDSVSNAGDNAHVGTGDSALHYSVALSADQLADFYRCNMERMGWRLIGDFYAHETVLIFEQYAKRSVISIRPDTSTHKVITQVVIFVSPNYSGDNGKYLE